MADKANHEGLSRLAKLRAGKKLSRPTVWPGSDVAATIRVLTTEETQVCHADAYKRFKELGLSENGVPTVFMQPFEDEIATQIILRAYRDLKNPDKPFALDADDLRQNTTVDERSDAFDTYTIFQDEVNPDPSDMTAMEFAEVEAAIKKKDWTKLSACGSATLVSYLRTLDSQRAT